MQLKNLAPCFFPIIQSPPGHPRYQPAINAAAAADVFAYYVVLKLSQQNVHLGEPPFFTAIFFSIWLLGTPVAGVEFHDGNHGKCRDFFSLCSASCDGIIMLSPFHLSSARSLLEKTVWYTVPKRGGTPNLHLLSHPLRRCNLSNESKCIVCHDAPLEFLNLPWCPLTVIWIAVVPSWTKGFPRQELQCPLTDQIRPLQLATKMAPASLGLAGALHARLSSVKYSLLNVH